MELRLTYLCKYEERQGYGGPEEGGWWYDHRTPVWKTAIPIPSERLAFKISRWLYKREYARRDRENKYGYTSVLSHYDNFYGYGFSDTFVPTETERPHYE